MLTTRVIVRRGISRPFVVQSRHFFWGKTKSETKFDESGLEALPPPSDDLKKQYEVDNPGLFQEVARQLEERRAADRKEAERKGHNQKVREAVMAGRVGYEEIVVKDDIARKKEDIGVYKAAQKLASKLGLEQYFEARDAMYGTLSLEESAAEKRVRLYNEAVRQRKVLASTSAIPVSSASYLVPSWIDGRLLRGDDDADPDPSLLSNASKTYLFRPDGSQVMSLHDSFLPVRLVQPSATFPDYTPLQRLCTAQKGQVTLLMFIASNAALKAAIDVSKSYASAWGGRESVCVTRGPYDDISQSIPETNNSPIGAPEDGSTIGTLPHPLRDRVRLLTISTVSGRLLGQLYARSIISAMARMVPKDLQGAFGLLRSLRDDDSVGTMMKDNGMVNGALIYSFIVDCEGRIRWKHAHVDADEQTLTAMNTVTQKLLDEYKLTKR